VLSLGLPDHKKLGWLWDGISLAASDTHSIFCRYWLIYQEFILTIQNIEI
jgi:hypothetical protein